MNGISQEAAYALLEALEGAVCAAEHIIAVAEDTLRAGDSPNVHERAHWQGAVAEAYAATSFVTKARAAIAQAKKLPAPPAPPASACGVESSTIRHYRQVRRSNNSD